MNTPLVSNSSPWGKLGRFHWEQLLLQHPVLTARHVLFDNLLLYRFLVQQSLFCWAKCFMYFSTRLYFYDMLENTSSKISHKFWRFPWVQNRFWWGYSWGSCIQEHMLIGSNAAKTHTEKCCMCHPNISDQSHVSGQKMIINIFNRFNNIKKRDMNLPIIGSAFWLTAGVWLMVGLCCLQKIGLVVSGYGWDSVCFIYLTVRSFFAHSCPTSGNRMWFFAYSFPTTKKNRTVSEIDTSKINMRLNANCIAQIHTLIHENLTHPSESKRPADPASSYLPPTLFLAPLIIPLSAFFCFLLLLLLHILLLFTRLFDCNHFLDRYHCLFDTIHHAPPPSSCSSWRPLLISPLHMASPRKRKQMIIKTKATKAAR